MKGRQQRCQDLIQVGVLLRWLYYERWVVECWDRDEGVAVVCDIGLCGKIGNVVRDRW